MAQIDRTTARAANAASLPPSRNPRKHKFCSGKSEQAFALPEIIHRVLAHSVLAQDSAYEGTPCWLWLGRTYVNQSGTHYGRINVRVKGKHRTLKLHRAVVMFVKGLRLTRRLVVRHLCNNTLCCNPAHLLGGTQSTNMKQCVRDGRHRNQHTKGA